MTRQADPTTGEVHETERQHLLTLLNAAWDAKEQKQQAEALTARLVGTNEKPGPLRKWADEHRDDTLRDGETGVYLDAKDQSTPARLDVMSMAQTDEGRQALLKLAELGLLSLNVTAWKAHPKDFLEAATVQSYLMPGGVTLKVEVKKG